MSGWLLPVVLNGAASSALSRTASDSFAFSDGSGLGPFDFYTVSLHKTAADSFSLSDSTAGASPSAGTATAGLIFLFSQGTSGSSYTRSVSDSFSWSDAVSRVLVPVSTSAFSRSVGDSFAFSDVAAGAVVAGGADATLVGVDLEFTALLETDLVFVGE